MLSHYVTAEVFHFFLTFCRVGTCVMLMPGFSSAYIPARVRLVMALALSIAMMPIVTGMPELSGSPIVVLYQIFSEIVIGALIGSIAKIISSALHTAGMILASQSGLAQAMLFDPNQSAQSSLFGSFLEIMFIALLFSLNLHHTMIYGMAESYATFPPVPQIPFDDFAKLATTKVGEAFAIGVQLSAPLIIVGLVMNLASGLLARLMPSLQVFFIIMPAQIMLSFFVFAVTLSAMMIWYMEIYEDAIMGYLAF